MKLFGTSVTEPVLPATLWFQSLVGFEVVWNFVTFAGRNHGKLRFQSLVGFEVVWNLIDYLLLGVGMFQSLVGFEVVWN